MINFYVPVTNDVARSEMLDQAIEIAKYNLGIDANIFPIDTNADAAIMSSNLTSEIVANLYSRGYRWDEVNIFMLRKDIHTEDTNFCFGATHGKTIILSDYRVWHSDLSIAVKTSMLVFLIEHELGHVFEAADDIRDAGIYDMHCKDVDCVMQQVTSVLELAIAAKQNILAHAEKGCFCKHCASRFSRNYWDKEVCGC